MVVYQAHVSDAQEGMDVPVSAAIFNKTSLCGFNLQAWAAHDPTAFQRAVDSVSGTPLFLHNVPLIFPHIALLLPPLYEQQQSP